MSSGGGNCVVCDRKIFSSQLSELDGNRYHHGCIKCAKCNVTLEPRQDWIFWGTCCCCVGVVCCGDCQVCGARMRFFVA